MGWPPLRKPGGGGVILCPPPFHTHWRCIQISFRYRCNQIVRTPNSPHRHIRTLDRKSSLLTKKNTDFRVSHAAFFHQVRSTVRTGNGFLSIDFHLSIGKYKEKNKDCNSMKVFYQTRTKLPPSLHRVSIFPSKNSGGILILRNSCYGIRNSGGIS